jgi:hypothetical protein
VLQVVDVLSHETTYDDDLNGNVISVTDALNRPNCVGESLYTEATLREKA